MPIEEKFGGISPREGKTEDLVKTDLTNPENHEEVLRWIKIKLEEFVRQHRDYMTDGQLKEQFEKIARSLAEKLNVTLEQLDMDTIVKSNEKVTYPEGAVDNGTVDGTFSLMGEDILFYDSYSDGYNFNIAWIDNNLKIAVLKLIQYLKDQGK